jgi:hypothetical protein
MTHSADYLQGYADCLTSVSHKAGRSEEYDRGYSDRYYIEQQLSQITVTLENEQDNEL